MKVTPYGTFNTVPIPGQTIVPINYGGGPSLFTLNLRLSKTFGLGPKVDSKAAGGPRGGGGGAGGGGGRGGGGGGGGRGMGGLGGPGGPGPGGPGEPPPDVSKLSQQDQHRVFRAMAYHGWKMNDPAFRLQLSDAERASLRASLTPEIRTNSRPDRSPSSSRSSPN